MWSHLERGSSPVDWCESNYSISPVIAEFVNTISNFLFFLLPPILVHLFQEYAKFVNPAINILWVLLMVVGLSSAYFHATLSLVGQLLDEFSILWLYVAALVMFLPRRHFPRFVKGSRRVFGIYGAVGTVLSTCMMVLYPAANAFALLTLFVPTVFYMALEINRVKCVRVYRLGLRCLAVGILAVFCWVLDRMFCETWLTINFPYMHGLWHIFIYISSSTAMVVGAYVSANEERPEQKLQLKYWPINEFELGVPYISVRNPCKKNDDNIAI